MTLSSFRGRAVLLLFFPQAFTRVCTQELCSIRDNIGQYEEVNAQVLGISVDSVFTLAKFRELQGFNFPLLSDFNKTVARAYGCLCEHWILDMEGVAKRSAFIIDREGLVRYVEILEDAGKEPDFAAISGILKQIC